MRRISIFILFLAVVLKAGYAFTEEQALPVWLIREWQDVDPGQPPVFRAMPDNFYREHSTALLPTRLGMLFLRASASAQPSDRDLVWLKIKFPKYKLTIVDLRQEPHGFLNGLPISWYMQDNRLNRGKDVTEILLDEESRLNGLLTNNNVAVYKLDAFRDISIPRAGVNPEPAKVGDVSTEKKACAELDLYYVRLAVGEAMAPQDKDVDRFVELVKFMDKDSWLHIHCSEGDSRATLFLAMFDMMHNAKYAGIEDIVKRQYLLGGIDLLSPAAGGKWESPYSRECADFIRHFYQYCQNNNDDFKTSWSEWLKLMR